MTEQDIYQIEKSLRIRLPKPYCNALMNHGLEGADDDHPEFDVAPLSLISRNLHFTKDPNDLSDVKMPGVLNSIKFALLYGSVKRVRDAQHRSFETWAIGQRFIIGADLGEEYYYIVLSEPSPVVYCYELESGRSRVAATSVHEWLKEIQRRMAEAAADMDAE